MNTLETYCGFEISADLAGYGYLAQTPERDGEPCLHDWTVEGLKAEIDMALEEDAPVNLLDAVTGARRLATLKAELLRIETDEGYEDFTVMGRIAYLEGEDVSEFYLPSERANNGYGREEWIAGWRAERDLAVAARQQKAA